MTSSFALADIRSEEFHERRRQARRSGAPAWLWPEVSRAAWEAAMARICKAAAAIISGEPAELIADDLKALSLAGFTSGIGPLLGWWRESALLHASEDVVELLAMHLEQARTRATDTAERSRTVVATLACAKIPVLVLKGGHTAHVYFPDAATRPASDLDLLVPVEARARAEAALAQAQFECAGRAERESSWVPAGARREPTSLWLLRAGDPWSVDLHSSLDFLAGPGAPLVRFDSADPFADTCPSPLTPDALALRQPFLLLHLAVHASGGLHSLTLLRIVELLLVIRADSANGHLDWDSFIAIGGRIEALGAAYPAFAMVEKLSPGSVPPNVLSLCAELAPPRVRKIMRQLEPWNAQRIDRASISEHFMWVSGCGAWLRQLRADLLPPEQPGLSAWQVYQTRAYRVLRGRITR